MTNDFSKLINRPDFVNVISCEIKNGEWIRTSLEPDGCASTHICPKKKCIWRKI